MISSKVVRFSGRRITRTHYGNKKPVLGSANVLLPKIGGTTSIALRRLLPIGQTLSHREFDFTSRSYRLAAYIGFLRDMGWPIVDHEDEHITAGVGRGFVKYELFAEFSSELTVRVRAFCEAMDKIDAWPAAKTMIEVGGQ